jgi:hypothetical protein
MIDHGEGLDSFGAELYVAEYEAALGGSQSRDAGAG